MTIGKAEQRQPCPKRGALIIHCVKQTENSRLASCTQGQYTNGIQKNKRTKQRCLRRQCLVAPVGCMFGLKRLLVCFARVVTVNIQNKGKTGTGPRDPCIWSLSFVLPIPISPSRDATSVNEAFPNGLMCFRPAKTQ